MKNSAQTKNIFIVCFVILSILIICQTVLASQNFSNVTTNIDETAKGATVTDFKLIDLLKNIANVLLGATGGAFVILFIYGGFRWMTAAGNDQKVAKAKSLLIAAVIGLLIVSAFYLISTFIASTLETSPVPPKIDDE